MIRLTLPIPPSVNALHRAIGRGRNILSREGREFYKAAELLLKEQGPFTQLEGDVRAIYHFYFPDKRRRDVFNYEKALSDVITKAGVWGDDCQIVSGHVCKRYDKIAPRVECFLDVMEIAEHDETTAIVKRGRALVKKK